MGSLAVFIADVTPYLPQIAADIPAVITAIKALIAAHEATTAAEKQTLLDQIEQELIADSAEAAAAQPIPDPDSTPTKS